MEEKVESCPGVVYLLLLIIRSQEGTLTLRNYSMMRTESGRLCKAVLSDPYLGRVLSIKVAQGVFQRPLENDSHPTSCCGLSFGNMRLRDCPLIYFPMFWFIHMGSYTFVDCSCATYRNIVAINNNMPGIIINEYQAK